tara:strand:+ start:192 stop:1283 length:1092 start_codon:yes stop_codon:yes gene_type:complete
MASDVMSLFGMDPRVIQQNRLQKSADKASGMSSSFAIGHAGGSMLGAGIGNMLGYETPDMAQASRLQEGVSGLDLNTPQGLTEAASRLMANGDYAQAMALHTKARDMTLAATTATNLQQDRSLGKSSNVVVQQGTAADLATMTNATPAKQHSITEHFDGRVMDVTQGKTFATKAEWLDSISKLYGPEAAAAIDPKSPNAAAVLKAVQDGTQLPAGASVDATDLTLGPKSQEVIDDETLNAQLAADDVAQTAHEENITLYDSMLPSLQTGPAGLELKAKIDAFEETLVSPISDAEFEAQKVNKKKAAKYQKDLGVLQNNINALQAAYANMPEISKGSNEGMLISTMLLDAIQEKDLFIQSNPQG